MPRRARARRSPSPDVHIALLRGINVGGRHKLPMKELASMFAAAGCDDVQAYIQSGNVVFQTKQALADRIPDLIKQAIADRFGFKVPLVTRTAAELRGIARDNPFLQDGADTGKLHVVFLAEQPSAARLTGLDPDPSPPDEISVCGREVFLHYPNGIARTKFTNDYFDTRLGTTSTVRNWRTVLKLLELAGGP